MAGPAYGGTDLTSAHKHLAAKQQLEAITTLHQATLKHMFKRNNQTRAKEAVSSRIV